MTDAPAPHVLVLGNARNYHFKTWLPALAECGWEVSLVSFVEPLESIDNVRFVRLPRPEPVLYRLSILDFLRGAGPVRSILDQLQPDLLYGSYATNYGYTAARSGFQPFALQTWTADVQLYPTRGVGRFLFSRMLRTSASRASLITTDGPALETDLKKRLPGVADKVVSILWGVDANRLDSNLETATELRRRLGLPATGTVVTFPRGLLKCYRPDITLPAIEALLSGKHSCSVVVLTLGLDLAADVKDQLEKLRRHPKCLVLDRFLSRDEMRDIWSVTDVHISIPDNDGISESVLEGNYKRSLPVLSDIPSNRSIIPDDGIAIFTESPSPKVLANKIEEAIDQLGRGSHDALNRNREWILENATIAASASKLASAFRTILSQHPRTTE